MARYLRHWHHSARRRPLIRHIDARRISACSSAMHPPWRPDPVAKDAWSTTMARRGRRGRRRNPCPACGQAGARPGHRSFALGEPVEGRGSPRALADPRVGGGVGRDDDTQRKHAVIGGSCGRCPHGQRAPAPTRRAARGTAGDIQSAPIRRRHRTPQPNRHGCVGAVSPSCSMRSSFGSSSRSRGCVLVTSKARPIRQRRNVSTVDITARAMG